jgi:hypothetical protein
LEVYQVAQQVPIFMKLRFGRKKQLFDLYRDRGTGKILVDKWMLIFSHNSGKEFRILDQSCQIFLGPNIPKCKKYTK